MSRTQPYIPNSDESIMRQMLKEIGVGRIEDLSKDIPPDIQATAGLAIPERMSEMKVKASRPRIMQLTWGAKASQPE